MFNEVVYRLLLVFALWVFIAFSGLVSSLFQVRPSAAQVASLSHLKQLDLAVSEYALKNGRYPTQISELYPDFAHDWRLFHNPLIVNTRSRLDHALIYTYLAPLLGIVLAIWIWRAREPGTRAWFALFLAIAILTALHQGLAKWHAPNPGITFDYVMVPPASPGAQPAVATVPGSQAPYGDDSVCAGTFTCQQPRPPASHD